MCYKRKKVKNTALGDEDTVLFQLGKSLLLFILFISIFILLTCRKATEALINRVSNYLDLLSEMPRYCCLLVI